MDITKIDFFTKKFPNYILFEEWELYYEYRFFKQISKMLENENTNELYLQNILTGKEIILTKRYFNSRTIDTTLDLEEQFGFCRLSDEKENWQITFITDHNFIIIGYEDVSMCMIKENFVKFKTGSVKDRINSIAFTFDKKNNFQNFMSRLNTEFLDLEENKFDLKYLTFKEIDNI